MNKGLELLLKRMQTHPDEFEDLFNPNPVAQKKTDGGYIRASCLTPLKAQGLLLIMNVPYIGSVTNKYRGTRLPVTY